MKVAIVSSSTPYGEGESFVITEVNALAISGADVLLIPTVLRSKVPRLHLGSDNINVIATGLMSRDVMFAFGKAFSVRPWVVFRELLKVILCAPISAIKNLLVFPKAVWLAEVLRRNGVTHVHAHWASTSSTVAMVSSHLAGVSWSCTAHRGDILMNNLLRLKISDAMFFRFISKSGIDLARQICGQEPACSRLLHMGVHIPDRLSFSAGELNRKRIVLCPANLIKVKGHAVLIEAWASIVKNGDIELWFAGDGPLRQELEGLVAFYGLGGSVRFLGQIPHDQLLSMYQRCEVDIVVLPSLDLGGGVHEGIPVCLMESMAYAIPVISTCTGGIPELVTEGAGILVPPGNVSELSGAISRLLTDEALRHQLGIGGRCRVTKDFNSQIVARQLIGWFVEQISSA